jgi:hypothetical protein
MMGPQDEINVYRRKAAWLATFRQLQETDPSRGRHRPRRGAQGSRPARWRDPLRLESWSTTSSQMDMALLQEAKAEIERTQAQPGAPGRAAPTPAART